MSNCIGVVRAIDDLLKDIENTNSADLSSRTSSETAGADSLSTTSTTLYLISSALKVAQEVLPSALHIFQKVVSENENPSAKPVSSDPYLDLSCSATSLEPHTEVRYTAELTRALKALAQRKIQLNWIDTEMARIADHQMCKVLDAFSDLLAMVSRSYRIVPLNSLFLDERIIPIESLFSGFDQDSGCRSEFLNNAGQGFAQSFSKWVNVDVGTEATAVKKEEMPGGHSFRKMLSAQFTSEDSDVLTPLLKVDSSANPGGLPPRLRMVLRGYLPEVTDEELDKLHAFDHGAALLRPIDRQKSIDVAELSKEESLFAGLMAHLAFTRVHMIADILTTEKEKETKLQSVLIRPLSASIACARIVKYPLTWLSGTANPENGSEVLSRAACDSFPDDNPGNLLISKDTLRCISNRFLPSLWTGDRGDASGRFQSAANPLMAELKKQSASNSSRDVLHLTRGLQSTGTSNGDPRFDAICGLLSKNRNFMENKNNSSVESPGNAEISRPAIRLRLRLSDVPSIPRQSNKDERIVPKGRKKSGDDGEIDVQCPVSAAEITPKHENCQENCSVAGSQDLSQDSGSLRSIPQMTSKHNIVSVIARDKSDLVPQSEPSTGQLSVVPKKSALFAVPEDESVEGLQQDSEMVITRTSRDISKSPCNSFVSRPSNSDHGIGANAYLDYSKGAFPSRSASRREGVDSGMKRDGAELLREASVHSNRCKSRLLNAQGHNIREEVRACLHCISSIVVIIADADYWKSVRTCVANYLQKKAQILASLRTATKEMGDTHQEAIDLPSPSFWNTILHALEQVVWQIAEGANRQEQRTQKSRRKKVPRHTKRAISLLNSIQLIAPSIPTQLGQSFFGEVLAEFLQVVLMKFLHGTQHDSFINALSLIFVDYDIDYSPACFAIQKENDANVDLPQRPRGARPSVSIGDSLRRSEANSDDVSVHSQRKRGFSETTRGSGGYRSKKPRKNSHRELSEIIADSRSKSAAKDRNGTHRSRHGLDLGRARSLQKPLSVARDKHQKSSQP